MSSYADSSVIVPLYVAEGFTTKSLSLTRGRAPFPFTPWHRLEVRNAIRSLVSTTEAKSSIHSIEEDLRAKTLIEHRALDWTDCLRRAEEISRDLNAGINASSPDLFHVACAVEMGFTEFLTFDERQSRLAKSAGLKVKGL